MALERSVSRDIDARGPRVFSSFEDLLNARISRGDVESREDLLQNRTGLLGAMLFDWYTQGQIACVFAQVLSRDPARASWQTVTVPGEIDVEALQRVLVEGATKFEAFQLVFPGDGDVAHTIRILRTLCAHPSWTCLEIPWMPDETPDSLLVGLRWACPGQTYTSWVLGIAPFESMPFTRRLIGAPFVALVVRPGPPTPFVEPVMEQGKPAAHLAHMNDLFGTDDERRKDAKAKTKRAKFALLGQEPKSRARARVTFALPLEARSELASVLGEVTAGPGQSSGPVVAKAAES